MKHSRAWVTILRNPGLATVTAILLTMLAGNAALLALLPRLFYNYIVIHHSGNETGDYASIRAYHERRHHWSDAGYHMVLSNGSTDVPVGHIEVTGRYRDATRSLATQSPLHNLLGIHVCVVGDFSRNEAPPELEAALGNCVRELQRRFWIRDDHIVFHRDIGATQCPGSHITHEAILRWKDPDAFPLDASVRAQQAGALGEFTLGLGTRPRIRHIFLVGANFGLLAGIGAILRLRRRARRCLPPEAAVIRR